MESRHPKDQETLLAPPSEEKGRTGMPVTLGQKPGSERSVERVQEETRFPMKSMMASLFMSGVIITGLTYHLITEKNPFTEFNPFKKKTDPDGLTQSTPSAISSADSKPPTPTPAPTPTPEVPPQSIEVTSPETLEQELKTFGVKATADDFKKAEAEAKGQKNNYMNALRLQVPETDGGVKPTWEAMKGQEFFDFKQDRALIATMVKDPKYANRVRHLGIKPIATVADKDNPLIQYNLYGCVQGAKPTIASISFIEPRKSWGKWKEVNLVLFPVNLAPCPPKNSVESK